ncbi:hypothetical protein F4821DRAFT_58766 [Hypoxylon rubiginosum]|uniref:Uncharacterized protein n=1 Tax=Hypoxylon rubiginosum TaxID=110542 RepID=A0ACC0CJF6_9PEZI|nr:hypothetical protein F4821DRAFT_58766 [Hypoxylon rubiginosum]
MGILDKFSCFSALPKELRDLVWILAFEDLAVVPMQYMRRRLFGTPHPLSCICAETRALLSRRKRDRLIVGPDLVALPVDFDCDLFLVQVHFRDMASLLQCASFKQMEKLIITVSANPDTPWSDNDIPPELESSSLQDWVTRRNKSDSDAGLGSESRTLRMCILKKRSDFTQFLLYMSLLKTYGLTSWGPQVPVMCLVQ